MALTTAVLGGVLGTLSRQHQERTVALTLGEWVAALGQAGFNGVLRGLSGLPHSWGEVRGTFALAPAVWQVILLAVVSVVLLVLAWRADREQALVSAVVVAGWCLVEPTLVLLARSAFVSEVGTIALTDVRYAVPGTVALLLCLGAWPRDRAPQIGGWVRPLTVGLLLVGGLANLVRVHSVVDGGESREWFANAREAFVGPGKPPLASSPSPPGMLNTFFFGLDDNGAQVELGTTRTLLDVGDAVPVFNAASDLALGVDSGGRAGLVDVSPVRSSTRLGFGHDCSKRVGAAWVRVPMSPAGLGNPILSVDVLARQVVQIDVRGENWEQSLMLEPGLRTAWFFPSAGEFEGFDIRVVTPGSTVCVGGARAGSARVIPRP
jgi:hypothetical protein